MILPTWQTLLESEFDAKYFLDLQNFLAQENDRSKEVFPSNEQRLRALQELDFNDIRVVILGQDPYHGPQQAIGRAFAVPETLKKLPPSLKNIFKELAADLSTPITNPSPELSGWVSQGVFLLNTVLTVRNGEPLSHRNQGWEIFTDKIIQNLGARNKPLIFILWGSSAQSKKSLIQNKNHLILESAHPSPLSAYRGFFGSRPFTKSNEFLAKLGEPPIDWLKTR